VAFIEWHLSSGIYWVAFIADGLRAVKAGKAGKAVRAKREFGV
jgi:hypothetical protein